MQKFFDDDHKEKVKTYISETCPLYKLIKKYLENSKSDVYISGQFFFKIFDLQTPDTWYLFPENIIEFLAFLDNEFSNKIKNATIYNKGICLNDFKTQICIGTYKDFEADVCEKTHSDLRKIFFDPKTNRFIMNTFLKCVENKKFHLFVDKQYFYNEMKFLESFNKIFNEECEYSGITGKVMILKIETNIPTKLLKLMDVFIYPTSFGELHGFKE
jgi:hypothetical protein